MASGWTNRGKFLLLQAMFRNTTVPTNFKVALVTSATAPTQDTDTLSQLTEIAGGNGYTTGGMTVARNATDWDVLTEDDTADRGYVQIKDLVWTASGGPIPASGNGARYAVLVDDQGTPAVWAYWDLVSDRTVSAGQPLTLQNCELRADET